MVQKPKIQYIGQFYVHGSEARALELEEEKKKTKSRVRTHLEKIENIYVDPVAVVGIVVALVMLVPMVLGVMQIREDWAAYETMSTYVSWLNLENARLAKEYRESYDLQDVEAKALALGMVPASELKTRTVYVTMPEPEPEVSRVDQIRWYFEDMFA